MANDAFITELINRRMRDRCITDYHLETEQVELAEESKEILVYNEFLFLANVFFIGGDVTATLTIESEGNYYKWQNANLYTRPEFHRHQVFTGQVNLTSDKSTVYVEFIRVVPRYNVCNECRKGLSGCTCNQNKSMQ